MQPKSCNLLKYKTRYLPIPKNCRQSRKPVCVPTPPHIEERIELYAQRYSLGLDLYTGEPRNCYVPEVC